MLNSIKDFFLNDVPKTNDYLYGKWHLITLFLVVVATLLVVFLFKNKSEKSKRIFLWILFSVFLTFEITTRVVALINGKDIWKTLLPMHFCSIMVWFTLASVIINKKSVYSMVAMGGILATSAYLIYPAVGLNVLKLNYNAFYSVFTHCLGFVTSVFLLTGGYTSYKLKDIWHAGVFAGVVFAYSAILNFIAYPGENYMYYVKNPFSINLGAWFQVLYVLVVISYVAVYYLTYYLLTKNNSKNINTLYDNENK